MRIRRAAAGAYVRVEYGDWSYVFDPLTAGLREVRFFGAEVLRGVSAPLRDGGWGTREWVLSEVQEQGRGEMWWKAMCRDAGYRADLTGEVSVGPEDLTVAFEIRALEDFDTQRTGMCVLHPAELSGERLVAVGADGQEAEDCFPERVSPHQPFGDITSLRHGLHGGEVELRFEGEVFEMEDQRNWTDASFKTYCRPLDWERPYLLRRGEVVRHGLRVKVLRRAGARGRSLDGGLFSLPLIYSTGGVLGGRFEWDGSQVCRWESGEGWLRLSRFEGEGSRVFASNYTELNRWAGGFEGWDWVGFGGSATVHASDARSVEETAVIHHVVGADAVWKAGGRAVHVGPLVLSGGDDPEWGSGLGLVWILGSLFGLGEAGVASAGYVTPDGWGGEVLDVLVGEQEWRRRGVEDPLGWLWVVGRGGREVLVRRRGWAGDPGFAGDGWRVLFGDGLGAGYSVCVRGGG